MPEGLGSDEKIEKNITSQVSRDESIIAMNTSRLRRYWTTGAYLAKQFVIQNARKKLLQPALARFDKF